jgi:hypothetical protein
MIVWVLVPCRFVGKVSVLGKHAVSIFSCDGGDSVFLQDESTQCQNPEHLPSSELCTS